MVVRLIRVLLKINQSITPCQSLPILGASPVNEENMAVTAPVTDLIYSSCEASSTKQDKPRPMHFIN